MYTLVDEEAMKVCVVGNCQAKQISMMMRSSECGIDVLDVPENYLAKEDDRSVFDEAYAKADAIFIQNVHSEFKPDFCRSDYVKEFQKPVIVWPVVYFDGYFPDIGYFRVRNETVMSVMGGYHSRYVRHIYLQGSSADDAYHHYVGENFADTFPNSFSKSIEMLKSREERCSVEISDHIEQHCRERQMFYTTNHPDNETLCVLLQRMLEAIGLSVELHRGLPELDNYIFPVNRCLIDREEA